MSVELHPRGQEAVHGAEGRQGAPKGARERQQHDVGRVRHQPEDGGALPLAQGVRQGCNSIDILDGLNPSLNRCPIWCLPKHVLNLCPKLCLNSSHKFQMSIELHPRMQLIILGEHP